MSTILISKISITALKTDIIVNAANSRLQEGGGVCGYIFKAAGSRKLQNACDKIGGCPTGSAVITPGFNLCKYIVHAVGPIWVDGHHHEPQDLYGCYRKSLDLAKENSCHSIGFPLISAGIFGYPVDKAWRKALQAVNDWISNNSDYDITVQFAILDDRILNVGISTAAGLNIALNGSQSLKSNADANPGRQPISDEDISETDRKILFRLNVCSYRNLNEKEITVYDSESDNVVVSQTLSIEAENDRKYTVPFDAVQKIKKLIEDAKYLFDSSEIEESDTVIIDGENDKVLLCRNGESVTVEVANLFSSYKGFPRTTKAGELIYICRRIKRILKDNGVTV